MKGEGEDGTGRDGMDIYTGLVNEGVGGVIWCVCMVWYGTAGDNICMYTNIYLGGRGGSEGGWFFYLIFSLVLFLGFLFPFPLLFYCSSSSSSFVFGERKNRQRERKIYIYKVYWMDG